MVSVDLNASPDNFLTFASNPQIWVTPNVHKIHHSRERSRFLTEKSGSDAAPVDNISI